MKKHKTKQKNTIQIMKEIRNKWYMNPVTRVKQNDKLNKKKIRQQSEKIVRQLTTD